MNALAVFNPPQPADGDVLDALVGTEPAFVHVLSRIPVFASADQPVLISGETGTGKELVARAIHGLGPRASSPFVAVNCGALVDTLLEDQLFGHERGAFTDAHCRQDGLIAYAARGTVLLDEVDTLNARGQVTLLRVLQDGSFRRVGSTHEQRVDVRFLAATNTDLYRLVRGGSFRADLYYRLCVFTLALPPLRERRGDVLLLAAYFLGKHAPGPAVPRLSSAAKQALLAFAWPGNVRELESTIVRAVHLARNGVVEPADLGLPGGHAAPASDMPLGTSSSYKMQKRQVLDAFEHQYLLRLMKEHHGNVSRAARTAGKERRDLGKLLKRHGFDPRQFAA